MCSLSLLLFLLSYSPRILADEDDCTKLGIQLDQIQKHQGNIKVGEDKVSDIVETLEVHEKSLILLSAINQFKPADGQFTIKSFLENYFEGVEKPLENPIIQKNLSLMSVDCQDLKDEASLTKCSEKVAEYQDPKIFKKTKQRLEERQTQLKNLLQSAYLTPEFKNLSVVAQFVASQKLKKCPEKVDGVDEETECEIKESALDKFASDNMSIIQKYYLDEGIKSQADMELACKNLLKSNLEVKACEGVVCLEGQDLVAGQCLKSCTKLEFRQSVAPFACLPDEEAQKKENLRVQENKDKWGKVARTSGLIVVAGGAVAGTAYLVGKAFEGKITKTVNEGPVTYTNYNYYTTNEENIYRTYNTYKDNSKTTNNYNYDYNYNMNFTGATSPYPSGYNPYMYSPYYFTPYNYGYHPWYNQW
jgi:hypothetical protein